MYRFARALEIDFGCDFQPPLVLLLFATSATSTQTQDQRSSHQLYRAISYDTLAVVIRKPQASFGSQTTQKSDTTAASRLHKQTKSYLKTCIVLFRELGQVMIGPASDQHYVQAQLGMSYMLSAGKVGECHW